MITHLSGIRGLKLRCCNPPEITMWVTAYGPLFLEFHLPSFIAHFILGSVEALQVIT